MSKQPKKLLAFDTHVSDDGTGVVGRLVRAQITGDGKVTYLFAPLTKVSTNWCSNPVAIGSYWLSSDRVEGGTTVHCPRLPWSALKTQVEDTLTGFTGRLVEFQVIAGYVQGRVQPVGFNKDTMSIHKYQDFDITHLVGEELTDYFPPIA